MSVDDLNKKIKKNNNKQTKILATNPHIKESTQKKNKPTNSNIN